MNPLFELLVIYRGNLLLQIHDVVSTYGRASELSGVRGVLANNLLDLDELLLLQAPVFRRELLRQSADFYKLERLFKGARP